MVKVLIYDRDASGCKRLKQNANAILDAARGKLELELKAVNRSRSFPGDECAEDLLLKENFDYHGVLVSLWANDSQKVIEYAVLGLECSGLNCDRIVLLSYPNVIPELVSDGIHYVPARGGNGYLLPQDAEEVIKKMRGWKDK